ncbi:unnamed protein product, partial [marine sediment metagenome]
DDGDGPGSMNGGLDEITCTFVQTAPSSDGASVTNTVTVQVEGSASTEASDSATVTTPGGGGPPAVGGIVGLLDSAETTGDESGAAEESPAGSPLAGYGVWAFAVAAAVAIATGAWYARRRWLR